MDEDVARIASGGLVPGDRPAPSVQAGQGSPSRVRDIGGEASEDAGTGGEGRHGVLSGQERDTLRMTLGAAHPDAIPELIQGETVGAMIASLATAKAAYQRTVERTMSALPVAAGGGGRPVAVNVEKLSPLQKISHGLRNQ